MLLRAGARLASAGRAAGATATTTSRSLLRPPPALLTRPIQQPAGLRTSGIALMGRRSAKIATRKVCV